MSENRPAARAARGLGFELFDLTVYLGPGLVPWLSAASRLGHVHGIPRRDPTLPSIDEMLDSVYDFVDAVRFAERDPDPALSHALGQLVFGEPAVLELFQATRGAAADRGRELLVRILASPHLAALPWELLPDPAGTVGKTPEAGASAPPGAGGGQTGPERRFLSLAPDATVVRLARGRTYPVRSDPIDPPLNLLVVLSSPLGSDPGDDSLAFDIYEEKRALLHELAPLVDTGLLHVDVEERPTLENLRRQIGRQRRGYHLFHYLGHAEPDRLILEDDQGRRDDQNGARLTQILRLCPDLRLAVFAGCETARAPRDPVTADAAATEEWRNIFSLADRCVQDCCPIVVGMQAVLPFRTERLFTRFFYQGIVSGYSVAGAMRLARGAARGDRHVGGDLLDWSVPVLFVGGSDPGQLLERSAVGRKPEAPPRHLLRLGLQQRETQFFARDVALRQAVDILSAEAGERILIITGPSGVGKTFLIDRALEELGGPIAVLYVRFEDLLPGLDGVPPDQELRDGSVPQMAVLRAVKPDAVLWRLCELVAELLARADGKRRAPESTWSATDWWPWLVEDLTTRRFVLVIDNLDQIAAIEQAIARRLVPFWLAPRLSALIKPSTERKTSPPEERELLDVLDEFIESQRDLRPDSSEIGHKRNPLLEDLASFHDVLGVPRGRTTFEAVLVEAANQVLEELQRGGGNTEEIVGRLQHGTTGGPSQQELQSDLARCAEIRRVLERALRTVAERRSPCRVAVVASHLPEGLLDLPAEWRFEMRLGHLTWAETWRWIRRNLPGLLGYGEAYLGRLWYRLGPNLEHWEELERRARTASADSRLERWVDEIAPRPASVRPGKRAIDRRARGERPLRIAVAGPHLAGPDALAVAFTRLAAEHSVGGRVVLGSGVEPGSLAVLIDEPSPFLAKRRRAAPYARESEILQWIDRVSGQQADVILLDYGAPVVSKVQQLVLQGLRHRAVLIASGGNAEYPGPDVAFIPAVYPEYSQSDRQTRRDGCAVTQRGRVPRASRTFSWTTIFWYTARGSTGRAGA